MDSTDKSRTKQQASHHVFKSIGGALNEFADVAAAVASESASSSSLAYESSRGKGACNLGQLRDEHRKRDATNDCLVSDEGTSSSNDNEREMRFQGKRNTEAKVPSCRTQAITSSSINQSSKLISENKNSDSDSTCNKYFKAGDDGRVSSTRSSTAQSKGNEWDDQNTNNGVSNGSETTPTYASSNSEGESMSSLSGGEGDDGNTTPGGKPAETHNESSKRKPYYTTHDKNTSSEQEQNHGDKSRKYPEDNSIRTTTPQDKKMKFSSPHENSSPQPPSKVLEGMLKSHGLPRGDAREAPPDFSNATASKKTREDNTASSTQKNTMYSQPGSTVSTKVASASQKTSTPLHMVVRTNHVQGTATSHVQRHPDPDNLHLEQSSSEQQHNFSKHRHPSKSLSKSDLLYHAYLNDSRDQQSYLCTVEGQRAKNPGMTREEAKEAAKREYNRRNAARARIRNKDMVKGLQHRVNELTKLSVELHRSNESLRLQLQALLAASSNTAHVASDSSHPNNIGLVHGIPTTAITPNLSVPPKFEYPNTNGTILPTSMQTQPHQQRTPIVAALSNQNATFQCTNAMADAKPENIQKQLLTIQSAETKTNTTSMSSNTQPDALTAATSAISAILLRSIMQQQAAAKPAVSGTSYTTQQQPNQPTFSASFQPGQQQQQGQQQQGQQQQGQQQQGQQQHGQQQHPVLPSNQASQQPTLPHSRVYQEKLLAQFQQLIASSQPAAVTMNGPNSTQLGSNTSSLPPLANTMMSLTQSQQAGKNGSSTIDTFPSTFLSALLKGASLPPLHYQQQQPQPQQQQPQQQQPQPQPPHPQPRQQQQYATNSSFPRVLDSQIKSKQESPPTFHTNTTYQQNIAMASPLSTASGNAFQSSVQVSSENPFQKILNALTANNNNASLIHGGTENRSCNLTVPRQQDPHQQTGNQSLSSTTIGNATVYSNASAQHSVAPAPSSIDQSPAGASVPANQTTGSVTSSVPTTSQQQYQGLLQNMMTPDAILAFLREQQQKQSNS